ADVVAGGDPDAPPGAHPAERRQTFALEQLAPRVPRDRRRFPPPPPRPRGHRPSAPPPPRQGEGEGERAPPPQPRPPPRRPPPPAGSPRLRPRCTPKPRPPPGRRWKLASMNAAAPAPSPTSPLGRKVLLGALGVAFAIECIWPVAGFFFTTKMLEAFKLTITP